MTHRQRKGVNVSDVKTYKPGLMLAAKFIRRYIVKWQVKLQASLGDGGYELLLAVLDAVTELITFLEGDIPAPSP